jgi:outer membrane protein OmpA-like peptidoglycan-associated protein
MAANILEMLSGGAGKELIGYASKMLGESQGGVESAVGSILPALMGGMMQKAASPQGAKDLLGLISGANVDSGIMGNLAGMLSGGANTTSLMSTGASLLGSLLGGDKVGGLTSALASVAGIKPSSVTSLLGIATPLLLGTVKKLVGDQGLDAGGLANLLLGQKGFLEKSNLDSRITGALGFGSLSSMLGSLPASLSAAAGTATAAAGAATGAAARAAGTAAGAAGAAAASGASGLRRWLPWLIGLAAVYLIWQWMQPSKAPVPEMKAPPAATAPAPAPAPAAAPAPAPATAAAPAAMALPASVYFEMGSAAIGEEGAKSIAAAAALLKSEGAKADLTGYTDKTGDPAKNEELAKDRAKAVKEALMAAGLPEASIGMKPPAFVTGSTEDRAARRVDITKGM